ncbi:histidine kinase [Paenibacillus alkaliterrae]|uniref:sensor histidine kinase n=1 Tax=Paenibacillus alkaliterrae TaxID=320909 RepID=UPI001F309FC3|nr:histidine kinase [Paenibacillus alkaliterrae]MCF2937711.1 histidine kinase [Paenibacillus alkaliterrae]
MKHLIQKLGLILFEQLTLKKRIILIIAAGTLIPFVCTALISNHAITLILNKHLNSGVQSNLHQVQLSLENTISNLNHVSQQLAYPGSVGMRLEQYLSAAQQYEKAKLIQDIQSELNLITFTNPSTGLVMYYFENDESYMFQNSAIRSDFSIDKLPLLAEYYGITYFGPHISNSMYNEQFVLSALRRVDLPGREGIYVYIESGFKLTQSILESDRIGKNSFHLILDNDQRISYSEAAGIFPQNTYFSMNGEPSEQTASADSGLMNGYYWFKGTSTQGWSIVSLIPKADYNQEKNRWIMQMFYLFALFTTIGLITSWLLWKMVYKPLNQFNMEMKNVISTRVHSPSVRTNIPEFTYLLKQFQNMKDQIATLFQEVELKEKRRADLEVEKLLYQINPHFLMNTLDTAHWLAVMNGQKEIDKLVLSLNKLLHYNLGKLGETSTIREEIDSLRQYLILQQIRYDFEFDVRIDVDDDVLDVTVPRFILQPLVENALYHGLDDEGYIRVDVKQRSHIEITIQDNGAGIAEDKIEELLSEQKTAREKVGMGIGMNYVKRMIESHYEGKAKLEINSEIGAGTSIKLTLPFREVKNDDERTGR